MAAGVLRSAGLAQDLIAHALRRTPLTQLEGASVSAAAFVPDETGLACVGKGILGTSSLNGHNQLRR